MKKILSSVVVIVLILTIFFISADNFIDNSQGNFDNGVYFQDFYNSTLNAIQLNSTFSSGNYTSGIFNAGKNVFWRNISWMSNAMGEFPSDQLIETLFGSGNANMSGNVLLMHMDETSGTVVDSSGNGNNGTTNNGVTYEVTGKINTALRFNGGNNSVVINHSPSLALDQNYSIQLWVKTTSGLSQGKTFLQKQGQFQLQLISSDKISFTASPYTAVVSSTSPSRGSWAQIVVTVENNVNPADYVKIYIDGKLSGTVTGTNLNNPATGTNPIYIGSSDSLKTLIDEVAIYNRTLSASEVLDDYKRGLMRLNFSVRSCDDSVCSGEKWQGPYGSDELPNNKSDETVYNSAGANMTGNVLLMHLNDISGNPIDDSGSKNTVSLVQGINYGSTGKFNTSLNFNGVNGTVDINYNDSNFNFSKSEAFTVVSWVKPTGLHQGGDAEIISHYDSSTNNRVWSLVVRDNVTRFVACGDGTSSSCVYATGTTKIELNNWYYVVGRWNGTNVDVYVNGVSEDSQTDALTSLHSTNSVGVRIGRDVSIVGEGYFNGTIDEVAIWNRSLSDNEISNLYFKSINNIFKTSPQNLSLANNQYFQYKFDFETDDPSYTTKLYNVSINYNVAPNIPTLNSPSNISNVTTNFTLLNTTVTDSDGDNLTISFYGDSALINTTSPSNGSTITYNWTNLSDGLHNWSVITNDGVFSNSSSIYFFTVDTTSPVINLESPSNNSLEQAVNSILFSYNVSDAINNVSNCSLYLNNVLNKTNNSIIELTTQSFSKNLVNGYYNWSVKCQDTFGNVGNSEIQFLNVSVLLPEVTLQSPADNSTSLSNVAFNCIATDSSGLSNVTLYGNWSGGWHANETKLATGTVNSITFDKDISLSGTYAWSCLATNTMDSSSFASSNRTLIIDSIGPNITINSPTTSLNVIKLQSTLNVTILENGNIWYNLNNLGNTSLCSNCTNANTILNFTYYGNQSITIYSNDSLGNENNTIFNFTLNLDTDNDGTPDSLDTDDDNDLIPDNNDALNGNLSNVNSNIAQLNLTINSSGNLSQQFTGLLHVNFTNGTENLVEFDYNFSANKTLNLGEVIINRQEDNATGYILVKGINLTTGQTKTIYFEDLDSSKNSVCVKNSEINLISEISSDCSGTSETRVACPGTNGGFTCTDLGSRYKVEGLTHSGIIETADVITTSSSSSSGGGGGGSSGGGCAIGYKKIDLKCVKIAEEKIKENITKEKIPGQLFDITLLLDNTLMQNPDELTAVVTFESFGNVPIPINLTFIILDESGNEYAVDKDFIVVEVKKVLRKKFKALYLPDGKYALILNTSYNLNISDEFKQDFEIGKKRKSITGNVIGWVSGDRKNYYFVVGFILIFLGILISIFRRGKKSKKKITFVALQKRTRTDFLNYRQKLKAIRLKEKKENERVILMRKKLMKLRRLKRAKDKLRDTRRRLKKKFLRIKYGNIKKRVKIYDKPMKDRIIRKK